MDNLVREFTAETLESLGLLEAKQGKGKRGAKTAKTKDTAQLTEIAKLMNTVRRASEFMGFSQLQALAQAAEGQVKQVKKGDMKIAMLRESLAGIRKIVEYIDEHGVEPGAAAHVSAEEVAADLSSYFKGDDELDQLIAEEKKTPPVENSAAPQLAARHEGGILTIDISEVEGAGRAEIHSFREAIEKIGGVVAVSSKRISLCVPVPANVQEPAVEPAPAAEKSPPRFGSYLLFSAGPGLPRAVPLEQVLRLEKIDVSEIDIVDDAPAVKLHGEIVPLVSMHPSLQIPNEGLLQLVVFTREGKTIGMVVDGIVDIVDAPLSPAIAELVDLEVQGAAVDVMAAAPPSFALPTPERSPGFAQAGKATEGKPEPARTAGARVLLVEDSPFFRRLTESFLASAGYAITAVGGGPEALRLLSSGEAFDLILTDVDMPGMSGFEFAAAARTGANVAVPIVAYATSVTQETLKNAQEAGVASCVVKTDRRGLLRAAAKCISAQKELVA